VYLLFFLFFSLLIRYLFVLLPLNYFLEVYFLSSIIIPTIYLLLPPVFFASFLMYLFFLYSLLPSFFLLYLIVSFSSYFVLHFLKALFFSLLVSPTLIFSPYISFLRIRVDALSWSSEIVKNTRNLNSS
jgi:hypothetical protein